MEDKNGNELKAGNTVNCNGLLFKIEHFETMPSGENMACGDYGCFNVDLLELVEDGHE